LFRVTPAAGSFRLAPYEAPPPVAIQTDSKGLVQPTPGITKSEEISPGTQQLVAQMRDSKRSTRPARNLPLRVLFPHFGPSIFLVSELTSENQVPVLEFDFQRDRKRGER
jgi:hypothetical protein